LPHLIKKDTTTRFRELSHIREQGASTRANRVVSALTFSNRFQFLDAAGVTATLLEQEGFGTNYLNKDGLLITEDSVFPTTAPGGAPKRNRCYQDARYFILILPLAPRFARALGAPRTAHYATPPLGAGAVEWLGLQPKSFEIVSYLLLAKNPHQVEILLVHPKTLSLVSCHESPPYLPMD
jgi:hypothetical protein